jgi:antitoxin HicB
VKLQDAPDQTRSDELDEFLARPYRISLQRDAGNGWLAEVDELEGCTAQAPTPHEAASKIQVAMAAWMSAALSEGREIPAPRSVGNPSGRLLLRLPSTLHGTLARAADREGTSLNQFITGALAAAVGWRLGDQAVEPSKTEQDASSDSPGTPRGAQPRIDSRSRLVTVGLIANFVVVGIAAIAAVVLLVLAW